MKPDDQPQTTAKDRAAWRRWLAKHHAKAQLVWLAFAKKGSGLDSVTYAEAVEEALCFGWIDGQMSPIDEHRFAIRFTPRRPKSIWSKANVERVGRLIDSGLMTPAGLAVIEAAKKLGTYAAAYRTADDVDMPPELEAALASNQLAKKTWQSLTHAGRRAWMRQVLSVKTTRPQKATEALALMLAGRRPGETDAQAARRGLPSKAEILKPDAGVKRHKTKGR